MQYYYGQQMPLRILDEAEFWKQQEEKHTVVIREAFSNLEPEYVELMKQWEQALSRTHQTVVSYVETVNRGQYVHQQLHNEVMKLAAYCLEESTNFIEAVRQVKVNSVVAKGNP